MPIQYYQYIHVLPKIFLQEVWDDPRYDTPIVTDGFIYLEIRRGIYGLKEAGIIAFNQLVHYLAPHGYEPTPCTSGLWSHTTRLTTFTLYVDNFGLKYFSKEDAHHLVNALKTNYEVTTDWNGSLYFGITLDWHYAESYVNISMPGYVRRALQKFGHPNPNCPQHSPHKWIEPFYGSTQQQQPTTKSTTKPLDPTGITHAQSVNGTFVCCG